MPKTEKFDPKYWAAKPITEIGREIEERVDRYDNFLRDSGRVELYRRVYENQYPALSHGGKLRVAGDQDEYVIVDVADFRNLISHLAVMTTSQRPAFEPKATNTDHESQSQTILATGLLEYYLREKRIERNSTEATEDGIAYGEGWVGLDWNPNIGDELTLSPDEKTMLRQGDVEVRNYMAHNVIRDFTQKSSAKLHWKITRDYEDKYLLMGKYPSVAEKLSTVTCGDKLIDMDVDQVLMQDSDLVPVYTLLHEKNEALPKGRVVKMVTPEIILFDGPLPFKRVHLYRLAPGEQRNTPFGWTVAFDLLPLQEALVNLYSTIATNHSNFGVQNILAPKGHGISVEPIAEGLNLIEYDPAAGPPQALNLLNTPAEIFKFIQMIEQKMEILSGINSVARGQPEASLKSGAALALVQSMAVQFNSGLQQSYAQLMEDVGTGLIDILNTFASEERKTSISGISKRPITKTWTGADLSRINRVTVDLGNPMSRTTAGRVNMAEALMGAGMIENPDQYLQVIATGKLDPMIEGKQAELLHIRSENEELGDGIPQVAVATDNHKVHIIEHKSVLASPEARRDPKLVQTVLDHLYQHVDLLRTVDPILLTLMGQEPAPPQGPAGTPPGQGPKGGGGVPGLGPQLTSGDQGPELESMQPEMPGMPENPMTGEPANPMGGPQI